MATGTMESLWSKANQTQLAPIENGTTTSRAYAQGEYFCWNGLLYRATTAISSGGTITPGTNCEQETVGNGLVAKTPGSGTRNAQLQVGTYNSVATLSIVSKPRSANKPDVALDIAANYIRVYYTDENGNTTIKTYIPA